MEVKLCLEEMEWGHQEGVVEERAGVLVKGDRAGVGWEEHVLELVLAGTAFVPTVGQKRLIR